MKLINNHKVCVVGAGKWGMNHIRTLYKLNALGGVVDKNHKILSLIQDEYPTCKVFSDLNVALKENFSSGQSLGVGLPAVKRLTDSFMIESSPKGTLIRATKRIGRTCGK